MMYSKMFLPCRHFLVVVALLLLATTTTMAQEERCGCTTCTEDILNADANGQTCEARIDARIERGFNETEACQFAAERYPFACNPGCHPEKCGKDVPPLCNCELCTEEVWNTVAGSGFSCGQWMLVIDNNLGELDRCKTVAERFPDACRACHPTNCTVSSAVPTQAPTGINETSKPTVTATSRPTYEPFEVPNPDAPCGCYACDETVLSTVIFGFSCQERIDYLQSPPGGGYGYLEACIRVAESFPDNVCGPACNPRECNTMIPTSAPTLPEPEFCTCYDCNETVLNQTVAGFTCAERIRYLQTTAGGKKNETEACDFVAREFQQCFGCGPNFCDGRYSAATVPPISGPLGLLLGALALLFL